jgi:hypothetical protein
MIPPIVVVPLGVFLVLIQNPLYLGAVLGQRAYHAKHDAAVLSFFVSVSKPFKFFGSHFFLPSLPPQDDGNEVKSDNAGNNPT